MADLSVLRKDGSMRKSWMALGAALTALLALPSSGAAATKQVVIEGRGWGHGLGMSQYGAYGRALNGKSSTSILQHYYKGAAVKTVTMPDHIRVGLLQGRSAITTGSSALNGGSGKVVFKVRGKSEIVARGDASDSFRIEASAGGARIFKNGNRVRHDGVTVFGTNNNPLTEKFSQFGSRLSVEGKPGYAYGKVEFVPYSSTSCGGGTCLSLVLELSMQKYVYGLGEVPSSWPQQALRSQAIAGRTYAYSKIRSSGQHRYPCDCAVYDSPIDQAYIGDAKRTGSGVYWDDWKRAVDATKASIVMYGGAPIQALYSSSSGGFTENNENVWGGVAIPYLRGVSDAPDKANGANPNFRWKTRMSYSSFSDRLNSSFGTGHVDKVVLVKPYGVSGRVTVVDGSRGGVRIVGATKTARASGWSVRSALALKDTWFRFDVVLRSNGRTLRDGAMDAYLDQGGDSGPLGLPTTRPRALPDGGTMQRFESGAIYTTPAGDAIALWGDAFALYRKAGETRSGCGYPTASPASIHGEGTTFERGSLITDAEGSPALRC